MTVASKTFAAAILAVVLSLLSASATAVGDIARGRTLYAAQCQSCHGGPTNSVTIRCANNATCLTSAINSVTSMRFLASILSTQDREDITAYIGNPNGGGAETPPTLSYTPSTNLSLSGPSGDLGASASGSIIVTPAGGIGTTAAATTRFDQCSITGGSSFAISSVNMSFVGATTTALLFTPSCIRTSTQQLGTLKCKETRASAAAVDRSWQLVCPAAAVVNTPPELSYLPAAGDKVLLTTSPSLSNSQATAFIAIDPIGGAGVGSSANKTLGECAISGADASAFSLATAAEVVLRPEGQNGYVDVGCVRADSLVRTATLACIERTAGVSPISKTWPLSCPSKAQIVPQTGWYWNAAEGGRGYFIENRNGSIFMGAFLYTPQGPAWWFVGNAPVSGPDFSSPMYTLQGGQSLTGAFKTATLTASPGTVQLKFATDSTATMTWPGGTVNLVRFPFTDLTTVKAPQAGAPEPGWWWNERESGRGFSIGFEEKLIFICGFMYDDAGEPTWYVSTGAMSTPSLYEGQWLLLANGQAMGAPYKPAQTINANAGSLKIDFSDRRNAVMTLPDGRTIPLTRQPQ